MCCWCLLSDVFFVLQVARLVEMGFSRIDALEALRASNNDINMATNFLLQHWESKLSEKNRGEWGQREGRKQSNQNTGGKEQSREKMLDRMNDSEWWRRQAKFVQIIRRMLLLPEAVLDWLDLTWTEPNSSLINEEVWSTKWETFAS